MANNTTKPGGFYTEVDRYRHRNGWGCLVAILLLVILAISVFWWVIARG